MPFKKGQSGNPHGRPPTEPSAYAARIMRRVSETRGLVRQDLAEDAAHHRARIEELLKGMPPRDELAVRVRLYEVNLKHIMRPLAAKPVEQRQQDDAPRRIVLNLGDGRTILSQPTPEPDKQSNADGE